MVRKLLANCFSCRRRQAPVCSQKMADLPRERVTPGQPPFSHVGIDYFGPFMVKQGRSQVKRYGCIFTCLTIRAVHIEIAHSLDTDSFINALRRFIARRGKPVLVRSDNGTNFVSGERELRTCIQKWNRQRIHEYLLQQEVRWIFNSPAASHHGGIWERCIRTTRTILNLNEQVLNDEGLPTLMCEVEAAINGRPIMKVSEESRDLQALSLITSSYYDKELFYDQVFSKGKTTTPDGGDSRSSIWRINFGNAGLESISLCLKGDRSGTIRFEI